MATANAVVLMTIGAETPGVRPIPGDSFAHRRSADGLSFAKSFRESVGEADFSLENDPVKDKSTPLQEPISEVSVKKPDEVSIKVISGKGNTAATFEKDPAGKAGCMTAASKTLASQETKPARTQPGIESDDTGKGIIEPGERKDELSGESVPPNSLASPAPLAPGLADEYVGQKVVKAHGDQPETVLGDDTSIRKLPRVSRSTTEASSLTKPIKTQSSAPVSKSLRKDVRSELTIGSELDTRLSSEASAPGIQSTESNVAIAQTNGSTKNGSFGYDVSVMPKPVPAPAGHESKGYGTKAVSVSAASAPLPSENSVESPIPTVGPEKSYTAVMPANVDLNDKTQSVLRFSAGTSHGLETAPGASVVVPDAPHGESTATKALAASAEVSTQSMPLGSREQNDLGAVERSIDGMPRLLAATPTSLEVGMHNGVHGWLKVRAEMGDGGVVSASVSAASSAGQQILHRDLPGLTAFLQEEKVAVNVTEAHGRSTAEAESRNSAGMSDAGGQTQQKGNDGGQSQPKAQGVAQDGYGCADQSSPDVDEDGLLPLATSARGISWLSVRA